MASVLYNAPDGSPRYSYSYSLGADFAKCQKMLELKRVRGWAPKEKRASLEFGKAIEAAITEFHKHGCVPGDAVHEFVENGWPQWKNAELTYSEREKSWEDLLKCGRELLSLYEVYIQTGKLKFDNPRFQVNFRTPLFPDDEKYGKIRTNHYVDMLMKDLVVDIKTAAAEYPESPKGWPAKDDQLRHYALETGIRNVAFLVLVKVVSAIKKGDKVTLLEQSGEYEAGDEAWVLRANGDTVWIVPSEEKFNEFAQAAEGLKGKALDALVAEHGFALPVSCATKQKIQFIQGTVSDEDLKYTEHEITSRALDLVNANELGEYLPNYGFRFPSNHCLSCDFVGICCGDNELVKEKLVRIDLDWMEVGESE